MKITTAWILPTAILQLAAAAPGAEVAADSAFPAPRRVTAGTRADPQALAKLQTAGKVFFEDDFETDASLGKYFEIRGLKEGNAKRTNDPDLAHGGSGAMQFTAVARDGKESGSGATAWFGPKGHDRVHLRLPVVRPHAVCVDLHDVDTIVLALLLADVDDERERERDIVRLGELDADLE